MYAVTGLVVGACLGGRKPACCLKDTRRDPPAALASQPPSLNHGQYPNACPTGSLGRGDGLRWLESRPLYSAALVFWASICSLNWERPAFGCTWPTGATSRMSVRTKSRLIWGSGPRCPTACGTRTRLNGCWKAVTSPSIALV
ncbi:hypothetical protein Naga_100664g2 [Nannochloropsis gaditana]|uniref:Uncharacterized protein n=1 Tax=Nannochloropsis gaditana TaxID=72520 RepID=W7THK3_9STRA|nr:hypothetical protein Naga_100664g2 [Nannochloropsis gaditana]